MKKLLMALAMVSPTLAHTQQQVATDSLTNTLDEVVITADSQIETAKKVILRPTKLEKRHSTNGYSLLENMNLPDFNVDASAKSILTVAGRDVTILVNGVEADPDELATLAASEIIQIDYRRNPGGRYVGSGAVMNFITVRRDYGGNIYLSADEGLARHYGNYIGMANYNKKALTLTVTANGEWDSCSQLTSADNAFALNDGELHQSITPVEGETHTNSQYLNFKVAHAAENHSFDISLALTRSATPKNLMQDNIAYAGLYDFTSVATRRSSESGLSPVMKMHYNLYLPGGHTLMVISTLRHGHTDYRSVYSESNTADIQNNTVENNVLASATLGYFKTLREGLSLGVTVDEYYNYYNDAYSGSFNSRQTLTNNHAMAMAHLDHNLPCGLVYYVSAGITDLYSTIGGHDDNQLTPKAFYGLTYAINQKHSLSLNGNYVHSIYNPSYKNDAVVRTSFFEATVGNPDLEQLNAIQNVVSYNGRVGRFGLSFTYDFLKYFRNTSNRYFAVSDVMYHQLVNDGSFSYNKLIFGASANLLDKKLRLKGEATFSINRFDSEYRPTRSNDWRADLGASYMFGDWQVGASYALPYAALGTDGAKVHNPAQYGLTVGWQRGSWAAECRVENFLDRRMATRLDADYGVCQRHSRTLTDLKGRNLSLSVTYTLPYGKKTAQSPLETETRLTNAILRPF